MYTDANASPVIPEKADPPLRRFTLMVKDALFLATLTVTIASAVGGVVIKFGWPIFINHLSHDLNVATREDLLRVQEQIDHMTGEHRIVRMPPGQSYVREPVLVGDLALLTVVAHRTTRGQACNYIGGVPLYVGDRGVPVPGEDLPLIKQLGAFPERLLFSLPLPPTLEPGRIQVTLSWSFSCPFGPGGEYIDVFDESDPVYFHLQP